MSVRSSERKRRLRRRSLRWILAERAFDRRPRREPDFLVVGAQKAGTTSVFAYLASHPQMGQPLVKEIHYFDWHADRGHDWYRRHFPLESDACSITGEASPMYMVHPLALKRIAMDLPRVKVVVVLRDPVTRMLSHYRHSVRLGHEDLSLSAALAAEESRIGPDLLAVRSNPFHRMKEFQRYSYSYRSMYLRQVVEVRSLFPGRSLFLRLEDLRDNGALEPLCRFLQVDFNPTLPFESHNVNKIEVPPLRDDAESLVRSLRDDGRLTCDELGWTPWPA